MRVREERRCLLLLAKALKAEPRSSSTNYVLGLFHLKNGEPAKAVTYFNTASRRSGTPAFRAGFPGVAYKQMGLHGSLRAFEQAIATNLKDIVPLASSHGTLSLGGLDKEALDQERTPWTSCSKMKLFSTTRWVCPRKGRSSEVSLSSVAIVQSCTKL
jgi:hypothetical protein